jgi:uncharacterized membrane protein YhiD involved in acid resistance
MLRDLNTYVVGRLLLAALLGGLVGTERELSRKPAGIRTNLLICLGAALFTIVSYEMASNFGGTTRASPHRSLPELGSSELEWWFASAGQLSESRARPRFSS